MSDVVQETAPRVRVRRAGLVLAATRVWRAWRVVVPVVVVNAVAQALLVWPETVPGEGWLPALFAALSALAFAVALVLVVRVARGVADDAARAGRLRPVRRRALRWLGFGVSVVVIGVVAFVGAGLTAFFWRGAVAALLVWLVCGLLSAWVVTAWALIARAPSTPVPSVPSPSGATPNG